MVQVAAPASESAPYSGLWSVIPSILWAVLVLVALIVFRKEIQSLLRNFAWRLRTGAALKLFSIELGQSYVSPSIDAGKNETTLAGC
jgi:hypothetical protein